MKGNVHPRNSMAIFKRVILYARQYRLNQGVNETLTRLIAFLQSQAIEIGVEEDTKKIITSELPIIKSKDINPSSDLIIVVGGDGSLLSAARMAVNVDVPVTGISRGRLGFLTDIPPDDLELILNDLLRGNYQEEHRFLLNTQISGAANTRTEDALNDVVLSRGNETHLIEFEVIIDNQFVSYYRADGLIISTPTGSTAYSLSAGGPIMHPALNAIVLVPMFSHSLSSRPLVVDGNSKIEIKLSQENKREMQLSCDGQMTYSVLAGQTITITKHPKQLRLLHPSHYSYYDTLRLKLGWGFKNNGS